MIIYKLIYITFILNYSAKVSGEIYFYGDEVVIHSQKDISNFYINLEALADMSRHIDKSIKYFKKRESKAPKDQLDNSFSIWLQHSAGICSNKIKIKRKRALDVVKQSLPDEIHVHLNKLRTKR